MLFACIYVPDFSVQALARLAPNLRGCAVAVLDGTPPLLAVISANALGRNAGIEVGMAKLHAEACLGVQLRRRSLEQEDAAHDAMLDCAYRFSPRVEDTSRRHANANSQPCDTIILDVTGLDRLFGPPPKIARNLASRLAKVGLVANIAVAGNPDVAMHAARGYPGITVTAAGSETERLSTLPLHLLEPKPEVLETFKRWGIRDFGALAALPEVPLSQRLGQEGLRLQKLARGTAERALVPAEATIKFEETIELEDAIELLEPLSLMLSRLLDQICERLRARVRAASKLLLTLEMTGHENQSVEEQAASRSLHQRSFQFPVPMQDNRTLLKLLQLDLAAHPPSGPIKKIVIVVEPAPPRFGQGGLFLPQGPAPERLELTLSRLRGIVGDNYVGSAELLDTHAPGAFRMRPFCSQAAARVDAQRKSSRIPARLNSSTGCISLNRPSFNSDEQLPAHRAALRVFRPPLETKVQMKSGVPTHVLLRGQAHQVIASAGPWRNTGGWWRHDAWTRDEWDLELRAEHAQPLLVRAYRDLSSAKWYLESSFD
jgi:protein ImuB